MSVTQTIPVIDGESKMHGFVKTELVIGLAVGLAGGAVGSAALGMSVIHGLTVGALFGLIFALFLDRRASTAGAGLIWGLAAAFLMWLVFPAGLGTPRLVKR